MVGKLEMLDLPEFNVDKETCRFRETGVLKWICHLRPTHTPCEGPEDIHFTITVRSKGFFFFFGGGEGGSSIL